MIPGLKDKAQDKAQLGLGHSYSRSKVKFNVNKGWQHDHSVDKSSGSAR